MNRRHAPTVVILAALAVVAVCVAGCTGGGVPLEETYWVCTQYAGDSGTLYEALEDSHIDAIFQDGQVAGGSGCNRYSGAYALDGDSIEIGPLSATLMGCADPIMRQEQVFLAAVQRAATYQIDGSTLSLSGPQGDTLVVFEADDSPLTGEEWVCTGYNNGQEGVVSTLAEATLTIGFRDDGTAESFSGSQWVYFEYEANDSGAMMMSPEYASDARPSMHMDGGSVASDEVLEQEQLYLDALGSVAAYELQGGQLTLRRADGATAATFLRP